MYELDRYLEDVPTDALNRRYCSILHNMNRLLGAERHVIPIDSFLSTWYWLRKEHQTRLEFLMRKVQVPEEPPQELPDNSPEGAPAWPHHPNACDVIFRFGEERFMTPLLREGKTRVCPASEYSRGEVGDPRTDDELTKTAFVPRLSNRFITGDRQIASFSANARRQISSAGYYVICTSAGYHSGLFRDFDHYDCCIVITDCKKLEQRLQNAMAEQLPGWSLIAVPVDYFDPYAQHQDQLFDPVLSKDFRFAYQMEYRIAWWSPTGEPACGYKFLDLGSLEDIAFAHHRDDP